MTQPRRWVPKVGDLVDHGYRGLGRVIEVDRPWSMAGIFVHFLDPFSDGLGALDLWVNLTTLKAAHPLQLLAAQAE